MAVVRDNEAADRRRKGQALKAVRRRLGLTQDQAAQAYKVTIQAWQYYEAGKRHLSDPKIASLLAALNSDREEFDFELAKIPEDAPPPAQRQPGMEERSFADAFQLPVAGVAHGGPLAPDLYQEASAEVIDLARFFAPGTLVLKLAGMSMYPYAEAGGWVSYNPNQPARRGHGCVVEMKDGSKLVKRFDGYTDEQLLLTELWPEERQIRLDLADVKGVYAIGFRGE